jgi:aspartyl-tRNA(Asn)/glutamyl-tRNA(Gln) amidotransferase subunit C
MDFNADHTRKVAKLAHLNLSDAEIAKFTPQLGGILGYFQNLQELDTTNVAPTAQVTGLHNVTRPDQIQTRATPDSLLDVSPLPKEDHQIVVPAVFS